MKNSTQILVITFYIFTSIFCVKKKQSFNPYQFLTLLPKTSTAVNVGTATGTGTAIAQAITLESFTPTSSPIGSTVILLGTNFSTTPASNIVQFNGTAATISAATATTLTVTVPTGATSGFISVKHGTNLLTSVTSATYFKVVNTAISGIVNLASNIDSRNIPGSTVRITGTGFSNVLTNNSVMVAGNTATVLSATETEVTFTVPDIASITENQTVAVSLTSGGNTTTDTTLRYFPIPMISLNTSNMISRTHAGTGAINSHWYRFTTTGTSGIINTSGYTGRDIDMNIYSSPTATSVVAEALSLTTDAESLRTTALTTGITYFLEVRLFSGTGTTYNLGIASQTITASASCSLHPALSRCIDYLFNNLLSSTDCISSGGTYLAGSTCTGLALGTVVGRCNQPSSTNIRTVSYYSNGTTAFNAGTAAITCTGIGNSLLQ